MDLLPDYKINEETIFMNYSQSFGNEENLTNLKKFLDNEKRLIKINDEEDFIVYASGEKDFLVIDGLVDGIDVIVSFTNGIKKNIQEEIKKYFRK